MADQATVSGNGAPSPLGAAESVVGNIAELGNDVATLAELQLRLAALDFRESLARAAWPLALGAVGLALGLGSLPVALIGLAELLAAGLAIGRGWSLLIVALAALVLASAAATIAALRLGPSFASFRRSREELERNLAWIRTVLLYSGRSARARR
jgi:uncharacterized membrane protein YqjE